jgi:hypothetical protein
MRGFMHNMYQRIYPKNRGWFARDVIISVLETSQELVIPLTILNTKQNHCYGSTHLMNSSI